MGSFGTLSHVLCLLNTCQPQMPGGRTPIQAILDGVRGGWDARLETDAEAHELSSCFCPRVLRSWSPR